MDSNFVSFVCLFLSINFIDSKSTSPGHSSVIQTNSCGIGKLKGLEVNSRIVRGKNATKGEFPWMALIHSIREIGDNYLDHFCGGALISSRFVVTAANCFLFPGFSSNLTNVLAGSIDRADDHYFTSVNSVIIHERFNFSDPIGRHFDIALIELSDDSLSPRLLNEFDSKSYVINTVCLPQKGLTLDKKERALFSGFGELVEHPDPNVRPNMMLTKAEYNIEDSSDCDLRELCGHETAHPSCYRDTGSPLVKFDGERAVLIGILAKVGNESRDCGKNWQYFTRISYFVDWIEEKIEHRTQITEEEKHNHEMNSDSGQSRPSLFVLIIVIVLLGAGSFCLTLYVIKKKNASDLEVLKQKSAKTQKPKKDNKNSK